MARILLIEEEPNAAEVASVICREDGHECATVADLDSALRRLENEPFDLVILDHSQPESIEREFISALRHRDDMRDMPVILLAPLNDAERRELERVGVTRALPKPFSIQMLQSLLRQITRRRPSKFEQQV